MACVQSTGPFLVPRVDALIVSAPGAKGSKSFLRKKQPKRSLLGSSRQPNAVKAEFPPVSHGTLSRCCPSPDEPSRIFQEGARAVKSCLLAAACAATLSWPATALALSPTLAADLPCANAEAYYAQAQGLQGPELKSALHDIISSQKVYTYNQAWDALKVLDAADEEDPVNSQDVVEIYTRRPVAKSLAGTSEGWNREHLWPRSYGLVFGEAAFSDLHNLRPADVNVNSARGNKWFRECSQATVADIGALCVVPANREAAPDTAATKLTWTPPAEVRGDIARSLLYMDLRYDGQGDGSSYDLALSDLPRAGAVLRPVALAPPALPPPSPAAPPAAPAAALVAPAPAAAPPPVVAPPAAPSLSNPAAGTPTPSPPPVAASPAGPASTASPAGVASPASPAASSLTPFPDAWLNEIHYDNIGTDEGEFIEVVARSGVKPDDITVVLYNGNDGKPYDSFKLSKFKAVSKSGGFTVYTLSLPTNGVQNGPADGVAIVQKTSGGEKVIQFVTYEGGLVGTEGPAQRLRSVDIGVAQNDKTPKGSSLGLTGSGKDYKDFKWQVLPKASPGAVNAGQTLLP